MQSRKPGANRSTWDSIRSAISIFELFGTWQYAQAVCLPSGARELSNRLCCASITQGRSGQRPLLTIRSLSTISADEPPRCTVAANLQSDDFQGIGELNAQSTLKTPGP